VEPGYLALQIENGLYLRKGKAETNFTTTLPPSQSDLARQLLKDPYNFEFLDLTEEAQERDVQQGLLEHIRNFLSKWEAGSLFWAAITTWRLLEKIITWTCCFTT
jgi:predicted nuclease of restriction endonuclease-like (RecB) superfamily